MWEIKKYLFLAFMLLMNAPTSATQLVIPARIMQPSSMSLVCDKVDCVDSISKFKKLRVIQPSGALSPLEKRSDLGFLEQLAVNRANAIFEKNPVVAMILIERGEIIYERYHSEIDEKTPLLGYSMSKSLTSLVVGKAHCQGYFKSLDTKMKDVTPVLNGSAYGEASIKQILTMSSGAVRGSAFSGGNPYKSGFGNPGDTFLYSSILNQINKFSTSHLRPDGTPVKPGEEFSYKNLDTQSLALLFPVYGAGSFANIFEKEIWQDAGAADQGYWVHDEQGYIHSASGFHGTARDWSRVALKILQITTSDGADCFTNYLKSATTTQIENTGHRMPEDNWIGRAFKGYGYQFWTENKNASDAIYLSGAFGQRIAISPKKQRIMVVFSYREDYVGELYKFFSSW